jgi:putative hydrolase of the HAD superfamily
MMMKYWYMDIKVDDKTVIVFDLDDTLYNEISYLQSAYREIAQHLVPEDWQGLYADMFSLYRHKQDVFAFLSDRYAVPKDQLLQRYRGHEPSLTLAPGAHTLLQSIKQQQGKLAIITDGRSRAQWAKIHALGIAPLLDKVVISEELGTEKPHENNYRAVEKEFGPGTYTYIADNPKKDFITPNALGWQTIGLLDNGLNIHFDNSLYTEKTHRPQCYINTLSEIRILGAGTP